MKKVLIVDDEPDICELLCTAVRSMGYEVVCTTSSEDALTKLDGVHIIITDWMMPRLSGIDLVKQVRQQNPYLYIIMVTAKTTKDNAIQGLIAGVNDYMVKPFDLGDLELRLQIGVATIELGKLKRLV